MKSFWVDNSEDRLTADGVLAANGLVPQGSTLLLVRGMTLRNDVPIVRVRRPSAFNQDVKAVFAKGPLFDGLLPHLLVANKSKLLGAVDEAGHGTGRLLTDALLDIEVALPEKAIQRQIAEFADAIEDKIDVNRRVALTLEEIARAIFRSWFVDFDPVRAKVAAKAEGRDPERAAMAAISGNFEYEFEDLPAVISDDLRTVAALMTDSLICGSLGAQPSGWVASELADLCQLNASSWTVKSLPEEIRYVDLAGAKQGEILDTQYFDRSNAPSRARRRLRGGDTIVGTVRPGNRSFALVDAHDSELTGSTGFAALSPRSEVFRELVYIIATSESNIERLSLLADGAAYPAVNPNSVVAAPFFLPPEQIIEAFHLASKPLFDRMLIARRESRALAAVRTTLLPRLLSGDISLAEAEQPRAEQANVREVELRRSLGGQ